MTPLLVLTSLVLTAGDLSYVAAPERDEAPKLILAPRESPDAVLIVHFGAGSFDDDVSGLTYLTQKVLVNANTTVPFVRFVTQLDSADASLSIRTGVRSAEFILRAPREDFEPVASALLLMLFKPSIDARFLPVVISQCSAEAKLSPQYDSLSMVAPVVANDGRYANPPSGDGEGLELVQAENIEREIHADFRPGSATVIVAGSFDRERIKHMVAPYRGGVPRRATPAALTLPVERKVHWPMELHLMGFATSVKSPKDAAVLRVAAAVLEEKLEATFRRPGVAYSYGSTAELSPWMDALLLTLPGKDVNLDLEPFLRKAVDEVRQGKVANGAFERNRSWVLNRLKAEDADPAAVANAIAVTLDHPGWYGPPLLASLSAMTREDYANAMPNLLAEEKMFYVKLSPQVPVIRAPPKVRRR